jgi:hypothetical protein
MPPISYTPRFDFIRPLSVSIDFSPLQLERRIFLRTADNAVLLDSYLTITTRPSLLFKGGNDNSITYPNALKIAFGYFDGEKLSVIDLTAGIIEQIRKELDTMDQDMLRLSYLAGMASDLESISALRDMPSSQQSSTNAKLQRLANAKPLSSLLAQLGESTTEASIGGQLFISNFLYSFINIPAISINRVLSAHKISLQDLKHPFLIISQPLNGRPVGGQAIVVIEPVYHNELIDEFRDLEGKIKVRLLEIHQRLAPDGEILQGIANTKDSIMRLTRVLKEFDASLRDQALQIQSLLRTDTSIDSKLDGALKLDDRVKKLESPKAS